MATLTNTVNSTAEKTKSALNTGMAKVDSSMDQFSHYKDEVMDKASVYYEQSEQFIRKNPFYFIGGAAVLGCLAGMLFSRKH